jgi:tetratricopeptide (TPR) repeat protein
LGRFEFLEFWDDDNEKLPGTPEKKAEEGGKDQHYFLQEAWKCYREGEFEEALRNYSRVLRFDSTLIEAWEGQVRCLVDLEEFREAETWLKKALGLYPRHAGLLSVNALVQALVARYDAAMASSDEALSIKTGNLPFLWIDRATVLLLRGSSDTAKMNFSKVSESAEGGNWFWLSRIGLAYLRAGKATTAADFLLRASELAPAVPFIWYRLGLAYSACHNQPRAKSCFEKAVELKPTSELFQKVLTEVNKKACFIATGLELEEPRLVRLRCFRDWLCTFPAGRFFCRCYFTFSPPLVEALDRNLLLKRLMRKMVNPMADILIMMKRK